MEEPPSSPTSLVVSSPRRTVSLLRNRRSSSFNHNYNHNHHNDNISSSNNSNILPSEHGAKPSEVYGFVGSITTLIATLMYLAWAYTPEPWLHYLGITYYPSKYWAIAVPAFVMLTIALGIVFYVGLNFMVTPSPTSFATMFDECSRERPEITLMQEEQPIEPICDIGIDHINNLMFGAFGDHETT